MNSTSVNDLPRIMCQQGAASLQRAIDVHRLRSIQTLRAAIIDLNNPAYKAIFKSNTHRIDIITRWYSLVEFPRRVDHQGKPTFRCIFSEREAQDLAPTAPTLWDSCSNPASLGLKAVGQIVFVCPPFFRSRDPYPDPRPQLCPNVDNNMFVEGPGGHNFPRDRGLGVTATMLRYYGATANASYQPPSVTELENDILRRNTAANANEYGSNLFFHACRSIVEFHSTLSSSCRNGLMMQQWYGTDAKISLM